MPSKPRQRTYSISLINILGFLILGWMNSGVLRLIPFFNAYVELGLFMIWFILAIISDKYFFKKVIAENIWIYMLIFSCLPTSLFIYGYIESNLMTFFFMLIIYIMYIYYRSEYKQSYFTIFMVTFLIVDKIIIAIYTIIILNKHPEVSRILAAGGSALQGYSFDATMIAGYAFVYSSVFLIIYLTISMTRIKKPYKTLLIIYFIITVYMVIKASYTIAFLSLVFFVMASLLFRKGRSLIACACAIVIIVFYRDLVGVIYLIADWNFWGYVLSTKIKIFADFLLGYNIEGTSLASRGELYSKSLLVMKDNILIGVYEKAALIKNIGNHTEWLDKLALFGLFRFSFLIAFIASGFRNVYKNSKFKRALTFAGLYVIGVGFINPILNHQIILDLFITIPFASTTFTVENRMIRLKGKV